MAVTLNANSSTGFIATSDTSGVLQLQTGGTTAVTVDASQNVGIGTASPVLKLDVSGKVKFTGVEIAVSEDYTTNLYYSGGWKYRATGYGTTIGASSGAITFNNTASSGTADAAATLSERMRIDSSGNVGIGTSSPSAKLTVSDTNAIPIRLGDISSAPTSQTAVYVGVSTSALSGGNGDLVLAPRTSDARSILFYTGSGTSAERARIDSSGNLLVGTTSGSYRVVAKNTDNNQLLLDNDGSTSTGMAYANNGTLKVTTYWHNSLARYYVTAVSAGVFLASGGTSWTSASDERVKDIIEPIENATEKLSSWRTVVGKYKTDSNGVRRSFLIAQDVLSTFPEAVDTSDENEYGVRYQDTIPVLVKAIQEQQALITQLQADVAALKGASA